MPAKLVNTAKLEFPLVAWKQNRIADPKPATSDHIQSKADEEAQVLRARIAELSAASEQASRRAFDEGRRAGEAATKQALENDVRGTMEKMAQAIAGLATTRQEVLRTAESDTVRLAIEIARRVLHRELSVDSSAIEALVKAALDKLHLEEIHRVKVHPEHEALLRACLAQAGRGQGIEIIADPAQQKGGASFELSRGTLDASVETQLREIERGLADQLSTR